MAVMGAPFRALACIICLCLAEAGAIPPGPAEVRPIDKVIELLQNLLIKVQGEATTEVALYDQFSCFCKTQTQGKSGEATGLQTSIDGDAGDIERWTAEKEAAGLELGERKENQEKMNAELQAVEARCAKEQAEFEQAEADISKALTQLANAIQAMENSKPDPASLLEVRQALKLADAMGTPKTPAQKSLSALLQHKSHEPGDATYQYHSQEIIDLLQKIEKDFQGQMSDLIDEHNKAKKLCTDEQKELNTKLTNNGAAMKGLVSQISGLTTDIANARTSLIQAEAQLKDVKTYLRDLTTRCEDRARDWDQRSAMRADELSALQKALDILTSRVQETEVVNVRALLQKGSHPAAGKPSAAKPVAHEAPSAKVPQMGATRREVGSISLLQSISDHHHAPQGGSFLAARTTEAQRMKRASDLLHKEGQRLQSLVLSKLAAQAQADPFKKVKELIQKLIERLLREATAEATKKGFCDTELGKAELERDNRFEETHKLAAEIIGLQAKMDELEASIKECKEDAAQATTALEAATNLRQQEHEENANITAAAEEGLEAVKEAKAILMEFYKQAAKATVLMQASPVDEDTDGPGFKGAYTGQQEGIKAVIGLLEVLESDYDRTIRKTAELEKQAAEEFVLFDRESKANIAAKETQAELETQELGAATSKHDQRLSDLADTQGLLDAALQEIEALRPTCIDTQMSYADRVAKREDEIVALRKALCILDTDGVEADCPPSRF